MRIYFYVLAGLTSALLGWNLGQVFLTDIGWFQTMPEVIMFPCVAIALAVGMVLNEIFLSNPTRPKLTFRVIKIPLGIAIALGLAIGLGAGLLAQLIFLPSMPGSSRLVRIIGWILIGVAVGLAEGITWRWQSVEAGDRRRYRLRLRTSIWAAIGASIIAALLFELVRNGFDGSVTNFRRLEDPFGFAILGSLMGLAFAITNSPSYMVALRAGSGFEYLGNNYLMDDGIAPRIQKLTLPLLKFVSQDDEEDSIEEGLSIQLPEEGVLRIGSSPERSNIYMPGLPLHVADIELKAREATLDPSPRNYRAISVNGERLGSRRKVQLKHNCVLTFHVLDKDEDETPNGMFNRKKIYRFIYYNRFLDPQS